MNGTMKYKVLKNNVFDGYKEGDIIEREPHAVTLHLEHKDCEPHTEIRKINFSEVFEPTVEYTDDFKFKCTICGKIHKIDSKIGQEHMMEIKAELNPREQARANLLIFKKILDEVGVPFWLEGGTLLGAYRDKDFCEDDEDDIDLCTWSNYVHCIPEIVVHCTDAGFDVYKHWDHEDKAHQIAVEKNGLKIDLFFYEKKGKDAWACVYQGNKCIPLVVPAKNFEVLAEIYFLGETFLMPKNIEEHLTYKYGDWKTKIHRSQYSCYDGGQNKMVRKDYDV